MIVRELVTKFGFDADFEAVRRWERAIEQSKRRANLAAKEQAHAAQAQSRAAQHAAREKAKSARQEVAAAKAAERADKQRTREALANAKAKERAEKQLAATIKRSEREATRVAIAEARRRNREARESYRQLRKSVLEGRKRLKELGLDTRDGIADALSRGSFVDRLAARGLRSGAGTRAWAEMHRRNEVRQAREELAEALSASPRFIDRFIGGLMRADKTALNLARTMTGIAATAAKMAAVVGVVGLGALGYAATRKAGEFESLQAGLTVAAGGNKDIGAREFERAKQFAKSTPFGLDETANSMLRLQNLGLDSSNETLTAFGNIAASFPGKTMIDFIEAVADATTFEFERLKEFGIKAKQEGDKVFFTFRGVTTEVKKTAADVSKYLKNIGDTTFAGAMEAQMQTFRGVVAQVSDAWDQFLVDVASHGLLDAMKEVLQGLNDMTGGSGDLAKSLGELLAKAVRTTWKLFQDIQPSLVELIQKISDLMKAALDGGGGISTLIDYMGDFVDGTTWFIEATGGMKNALFALLPAIAAVSVAMLGLTGVPGLVAAAIIGAMPALIELGNWMGEALADLKEARLAAEQGVPTVTDRRHADANGVVLAAGAHESVDRVIKNLSNEDLREVATKGTYGGGKMRVQWYAKDMAQGERTLRGLEQTDADFKGGQMVADMEASRAAMQAKNQKAIDRANARATGGKGKKKKTKKKKKELSLNEILERDFGGGLGNVMKAADGSEFRPTLGTTINKVTLDNHPTINLNFEMPPIKEGETADNYSERVIRQVATGVFNEQLRIATEYFKGAGTG